MTDDAQWSGQRKFVRCAVLLKETFHSSERQKHPWIGSDGSSAAEGAFVSPSHLAALRNNLRSGERGARTGISLP